MRKIHKRKILLASILLFSIFTSSDQIIWTCTEPDIDDSVTTCINSKGKKLILTTDNNLSMLGNDFKATLKILGTSNHGTVVGKDGIYYADLYYDGMFIKGNINKDLVFIGDYIEVKLEKQEGDSDRP